MDVCSPGDVKFRYNKFLVDVNETLIFVFDSIVKKKIFR